MKRQNKKDSKEPNEFVKNVKEKLHRYPEN